MATSRWCRRRVRTPLHGCSPVPPPPAASRRLRHSPPSLPPTHPGEDLWHAFNLVREGDRVEATTFRKVTKDLGTGTESERVKIRLMVAVEAVEYDAEGACGWVWVWVRRGCMGCMHACDGGILAGRGRALPAPGTALLARPPPSDGC